MIQLDETGRSSDFRPNRTDADSGRSRAAQPDIPAGTEAATAAEEPFLFVSPPPAPWPRVFPPL